MKILLSYAPADEVWVQALVSLLQAAGLDPETSDAFPLGDDWETLVREQIESADLIVSVMTDRALQSSWVLFVYGAAKSAKKPVMPLRVSTAKAPPEIRGFQSETFRWIESPQDAAEQIQRYVTEPMAAA